jgi:hypothetical protein
MNSPDDTHCIFNTVDNESPDSYMNSFSSKSNSDEVEGGEGESAGFECVLPSCGLNLGGICIKKLINSIFRFIFYLPIIIYSICSSACPNYDNITCESNPNCMVHGKKVWFFMILYCFYLIFCVVVFLESLLNKK